MDIGFGDPSLSSTQLRQKAYSVIKNSDRPLASSEIEKWIRNNDYDLWCKVSNKCKDYVRVILSQTRGRIIAKFKALKPVPGIDKRSTFYGLYGRSYPADAWATLSDGSKHKPRHHDDEDFEEKYQNAKEEVSQYSDDSQDSSAQISELPKKISPTPVKPKERILLPPLPPFNANLANPSILPSFLLPNLFLQTSNINQVGVLLN